MTMHWVIGENMFGEQAYGQLIQALEVTGTPFTNVKFRPFINTIEPDVDFPPGLPVFVSGTTGMAEVAKRKGWLNFSVDDLTYEQYLAHYGPLMFNDQARIMPMCDLTEADVGGADFFIRPNEDSKSFAGEVMNWPAFVTWRDSLIVLAAKTKEYNEPPPKLTVDTKIVVAEAKAIECEWRFFVVDGKVISGSVYRYRGRSYVERVFPEHVAWNFAQAHANIWSPARAFVIDMALDCNNNFKILELGSIHLAGFYANNMWAIVKALNEMENL